MTSESEGPNGDAAETAPVAANASIPLNPSTTSTPVLARKSSTSNDFICSRSDRSLLTTVSKMEISESHASLALSRSSIWACTIG